MTLSQEQHKSEREEFNRWYENDYMAGLDGPGEFDDHRNCYAQFQVHMAWCAYQAGRASMLRQPTGSREAFEAEFQADWEDPAMAQERAIWSKAWAASMLRPIPEVEEWRLVPIDLNAFAEVCHNAHIDYALDKFPSYERAIEHHYITLLNALRDQSPPSNVEPT